MTYPPPIPRGLVLRNWSPCRRGMLRRVEFALGSATVRLLSTRLCRYLDGDARVYHVQAVETGHCDFVGAEYLSPAPLTSRPPPLS